MFTVYPDTKCCQCERNISSAAPRMLIGEQCCCTDCFEDLIVNYCQLGGMGGMQPFVLISIAKKCFKLKNRAAIPRAIRQKVLNKYQFTCCFCGAKSRLEIDHIQPVSKGGEDKMSNYQVLCKSCNSKKSNKIISRKDEIFPA